MTRTGSVPVSVSGAVEGFVDEAVLRRMLEHVGAKAGTIYGKNGKQDLRKRIHGYNDAARRSPWAVLVDLNHEADCAPALLASWLKGSAPLMCFRVAVHETESWLLADPERLARFIGSSVSLIPRGPEKIDDPKLCMVNLARRSRRRGVREDMVPRDGSGRDIGPAYTSRLMEFAQNKKVGWRPQVAARNSDSLKRALHCLRRLVASAGENRVARR